jgi:hypothetical protein
MSYLDHDSPMTLRKWLASASRQPPKVSFWRPTIPEVLRQAGWVWAALILPILLTMTMVALGFVGGRKYVLLWWVGLRLMLISLALPFLLWDHLKTKVYLARRDPFCVHCGYTILGLPEEGTCPECGRTYRMSVIKMFRHDPQWVISYWRFDGHPPSVERFSKSHPRAKV